MSHQKQLDKMCPRAGKLKLGIWLQSIRTWVVDMVARQEENKALLDELHDDHAAFKAGADGVETLIEELHDDHATFKTAVDETKTLADELHDDHATFKTAVDETKTLADELHDDHATFKTAVDETKTLADELHDDHAMFKTAVDETKTLADEFHDDHATFKTAVDETKTAVDELIDDHAVFKSAMDNMKTALKNMCLSDPGIDIGTVKTRVRTTATFAYLINGEFKSRAAADHYWVLTGFDCTNGKYNKSLLCADTNGSSQLGIGTEADTAADVVLPAIPASWSVIGMLQVNPTGTGDFTGETTDLDDATVAPNAVFTDLAFHPDIFGTTPDTLSASKPSAGPGTLSASKPSAGPDTLSASKPSAGPGTLSASKPSAGPDTLSASKPSAGPDTLSASKPSAGPDTLSASKPTALSAPTPSTLAQ